MNFLNKQGQLDEKVKYYTPQEHLANIRIVFKLSVSDMGLIFDVSRKNIYMWLSNSITPEDENLLRIEQLSKIADVFKDSGVSHPHSLLKMKNLSSKNLIDIIKSGENWIEAVDFLISESRKMSISYENSGLKKSKSKPNNDWKATYSIPGYCENL